MCAASVQTIAYARHVRRFRTQSGAQLEYPLQRWPRILQFLHMLLWSTVTTFRMYFLSSLLEAWQNILLTLFLAFIVTVVYWVLLASSSTFQSAYSSKRTLHSWSSLLISCGPLGWNNITVHAMNSAFALFEVLLTRAGPMPWTHVPFLIILLAAYLGLAYVTHATQGFYSEQTESILLWICTNTT
jgi:hypothetical protein